MDKYEKEIIRFTKELRIKMLEKYRKGKIEHGGEPSAIDPQKEIHAEVLDILNYHLIARVNNGTSRQT
jgi:hypothetical protein